VKLGVDLAIWKLLDLSKRIMYCCINFEAVDKWIDDRRVSKLVGKPGEMQSGSRFGLE
jgi:hypothetical protein